MAANPEDVLPLVKKLCAVLITEPDPVKQQMAIELLVVYHAIRMKKLEDSLFVIDNMHKHVRQFLGS